MQLLSDVIPRIQETTIDTKSCSHPEIPRLVLGDLLNDVLRDKSAPVDDPFLIQHSFPSLSGGQSAASKSANKRHLTPLSALTLLSLTRGVSCSVIAELVDAMTADEEQSDENAQDGSILPLIVRGGNSMCVESFRMMRDALDEVQLGPDVSHPPVPGTDWRKVECDLHVVSLRHADGIDDRVLLFFDAICEDWKSRFVGINSGIDRSDIQRKTVENKLFKVLKSVEGVGEVQLIDKELDNYARQIFADLVAKMSDEEFVRIVDSHEKRSEKYLNKEHLMGARKGLVKSLRFKNGCGVQATCATSNTEMDLWCDWLDLVQDWSYDELRDFAYSLKTL
ncbi:hypothetical protein FGB62_9g06 [Gracilaria domingensis]|nr:hypothetical protein FGB62_9g06 [Gracilaria domingensis]